MVGYVPRSVLLLILYVADVPHQIASLLSHPCRGRVSSTTGKMYSPSAELDKEQDVQGLQTDRFHGEEVTCYHLACVVPQE